MVASRRRLAKVVIKADYAMNFGVRNIERVSDQRHRGWIDIPELILQGVQDR
jgi:hypothetical protein